MLAVIAFGATFANAGIIIGGAKAETDPCTTTSSTKSSKFGIIIGGFTGIIIGGFTGIIIGGALDSTTTTQTNCGIIIGG